MAAAASNPNPNDLPNTNGLVSAGETPKYQKLVKLNRVWRSFFEEPYSPDFPRKVAAEMIATFLLVFVTCGSAALSTSDEQRVSKLGASIAGGLVVTVLIYAVGHISGAHMNPAVTVAFAAVRHFPWKQVPFYSAAQFTGSISASFTLRILLHPIKHVGTTSPSGTQFQALVMEIFVSFSMMFVTSAVATDTRAIGELAGLAVGSAVCITSILAGFCSSWGRVSPVPFDYFTLMAKSLYGKLFEFGWVLPDWIWVGSIRVRLGYTRSDPGGV